MPPINCVICGHEFKAHKGLPGNWCVKCIEKAREIGDNPVEVEAERRRQIHARLEAGVDEGYRAVAEARQVRVEIITLDPVKTTEFDPGAFYHVHLIRKNISVEVQMNKDGYLSIVVRDSSRGDGPDILRYREKFE